MICYLPFTHMDLRPIELVVHALGPVRLYYPMTALVPDPLQKWLQQGELDVCTPAGMDQNKLLEAFQAFNDWAKLHDGQLQDMIQFYTSHQGRPPMMDASAPSQISTQIRHFHDKQPDDDQMLFQAALYICLAHEYDQHQERVRQDLRAVLDMERTMYATIGGDTQEIQSPETGQAAQGDDPGAYMTRQRLEAWAHMASSVPQPPQPAWCYVTPSVAVYEYVKGLGTDVVEWPLWHLAPASGNEALKEKRCQFFKEFSTATDLERLSADVALCGDPDSGQGTLQMVSIPGEIVETLLSHKDNSQSSPQNQRVAPHSRTHTLVGWLDSGPIAISER